MGRKKEMIREVLENFDFEKVEDTMSALGWQWASSDYYVPTLQELLKCAKRCLKNAYELAKDNRTPEVSYSTGTGGFVATAICNDAGKVDFLQLDFVVSSWEANYSK